MDEIINILLIEDEDPHAELIQRAFEDQDSKIQIQRAKTLTEARAQISSSGFSLIIADWRLPDGDSLELFKNQPHPLNTPIIFMTSFGSERLAVEALKSGVSDYVVKSTESMLDMPHLSERALQQWAARAEHARTQNALRESESQFRLLAENATDMIARLAMDGHMVYVSPACKTILGYLPEELIGTNCLDLIHEEERGFVGKLFGGKTDDDIYTVTYRALHQNGHFVWLESSARVIHDRITDSAVEIQTASRDITERKNAERALISAHERLQEAYQKTIEGWARALDLRDRETEGHTQRVTELTVKVAEALGVSSEEIIHIRRGALLHDMGKIAIPDSILQKPGTLNEDEWEKMRMHPMFAYEMLSPIAYLERALEIPLCHHEYWDGSGYPRGLKGEEIPLSARLFTMVDVWDALRSDRRYRKKMERREVLNYMKEKSGNLFDPNLLGVFLSVIEKEP
ncbi:MAG: PAS domain S-box protein [Chloroflexi bacterium]|nr:PAS domain S-box protein [Chloroflexota bacterium]